MLKGMKRGKYRPPRIVLYGRQGIGKSTVGADSPSPGFVATEDGVDNLPVWAFDKAKSWEEFISNVKEMATDEHEFKTVVIDTLNGAVDLAAQHVCTTMYGGQWTAKKGDGGFLGWGQGWKATAERMRELLILLDDCRARGMTILLLAHTGLQNVQHPIDGTYQKFAPDVDKTVWGKVFAWSDIVLRADYEYSIIKERGDLKGRAMGTSTRRLYCRGSAAEDAKCRVGYELPEEMDLSWEALEGALGKGSATLEEVQELWHLLDEPTQNKTMAWLGVQKIEDAPLTKMRQVLNRLRQIQVENQKPETEEVKS